MSISPASPLLEQRDALAAGRVTASALVQESLARIAALDGQLNAFAHVRAERAVGEAQQLDADFADGKIRGPLHGVPIVIKEENNVAGVVTGLGGAANVTPAAAHGEVVRRLVEAGAVVVGTTRMPEFGIWPFTESEAGGVTRNPWDIARSPAGSSGGTAAAVAAGIVSAGIGGDGGGSIRLPASWCGLFGLKPQRGRVSAAPAPNLWRSLGTLGPLTRTVADSALIYDVVSGSLPDDSYRADPLGGSLLAAASAGLARPLRILLALQNPAGGPGPDTQTEAALRQLVGRV